MSKKQSRPKRNEPHDALKLLVNRKGSFKRHTPLSQIESKAKEDIARMARHQIDRDKNKTDYDRVLTMIVEDSGCNKFFCNEIERANAEKYGAKKSGPSKD